MLCTSGFVDDITFSHNGVSRVYSRISGERTYRPRDFNDKEVFRPIASCAPAAKSAIYDCLVVDLLYDKL